MRGVVVDPGFAGPRWIGRGRSERAKQDLTFFIDERPRRRFGLDRCGFGAEINHFRQRPFLRFANGNRFALGDAGDFARRIIEVAKNPAFGRTDAHAGRQQTVLDAIRAEVALFRGMRIWIDEQLIVGARHHARAAADADVTVQIDDAVAAFEEGACRADADAWRLVALVAEHREEEALRLRKRALLDRFDPAAVHADRDLVLGLTGDRARVAADAFVEVDREPVVGHPAIRLYQTCRALGTPLGLPQSHRAATDSTRRRGTETQR